MFVEHLADGRVKYGMYYEYYLTGKKRRATITYDKDTKNNRRMAEHELEDRIARINKPAPIGDKITLSELCRLYLAYQKTAVKLSTWTRDMRFCNSTMSILGEDTLIKKMTADYVRTKFIATGDDPGGLNERLARFKALMRWGYRQGYIDNTVMIDRIQPWKDIPHKIKIQDKYLEKDELKLLLNEMSQPIWRDLTEFLALSGLRFGEAAALVGADLDLENRYIHVTKTLDTKNVIVTDPKTFTSSRDVYIQQELLPLCRLLKTRSQGGLVFTSGNGEYCNYFSYNKYLKENTKAIIDRELTTHALRHTHTSLCAEAGMDLDAISRRLGHSNSRITKEIYLHITKKMQQRDNEKMDRIKILS